MMTKLRQNSFLWAAVFLLSVMTFYLQSHLLLKGDVCWQMHIAKIILNGGHYATDFFEINPPLSIYLYMLPVILGQHTALPLVFIFRLYFVLISLFSFIIVIALANKIFNKNDSKIKVSFLISLYFVYTIFPVLEFGQREGFYILFTMPYFLLTVVRLKRVNVSVLAAFCIGALAGIGIALKPFFLASFVLVECYYLFQSVEHDHTKLINLRLRTETIVIILTLLIYFFYIVFYHIDYIQNIVPIASRFYYQFFGYPLKDVLDNFFVFFSIFALFCSIFIRFADLGYNYLIIILGLVVLGNFITYVSQQVPWYYHIMPMFSVAFLLACFIITLLFNRRDNVLSDYFFITLLMILFLFFPIYFLTIYYHKGFLQKKLVNPIVVFLHQKEMHRPIYFFSAKTAYMVSVLTQADVEFASRLQFLSWMNAYYKIDEPFQSSLKLIKDEQFFVKMLADDLVKNKPDLIFVDTQQYELHNAKKMSIDYLAILSRFNEFKKVWKDYHFMTNMKNVIDDQGYHFVVYERNKG